MLRRCWLPFLPLLLLASPGRAQLVRDWRAARSAHFEFISRYDPAKVSPLVRELEWARAVFEANFGLKSMLDRPVLVFVTDSPFDYEQMIASKYSAGFYLGAPWRDIIVLRDLFFQARHALFHEYGHLIMHHQGGRVPAWFHEGTAEYYATLRASKDGVEAGAPEPQRVSILKKGAWVPISYLVSVKPGTDLPSHDAVARYYAQCWLYTHMLHLSPAYSDRFQQFRTVIADGVSTEQALRRIYSKSLSQFDEDARVWLRQARFPVERLKAPPEPAAQVEEKVIADFDAEIARSTVAASGPRKAQAGRDYARLNGIVGERCEPQAALGDLAYAASLFREAAARYQQALRCGLKATGLVEGLAATFGYRDDVRPEELEAVVALGGGGRTRFLLGTARFFSKEYESALREFEQASGLSQPEEFRMLRMQAISLAILQRHAEAQKVAESLPAKARDDYERQSAQLTLEDIRRYREGATP